MLPHISEVSQTPDATSAGPTGTGDHSDFSRSLLQGEQPQASSSSQGAEHSEVPLNRWDDWGTSSAGWEYTGPDNWEEVGEAYQRPYERPKRPNNVDAGDHTDYSQVFKNIEGLDMKDIIQRIPEVASVSEVHDHTRMYNPLPPGPKFEWYDSKDTLWTVRFHEHQYTRECWTVRVSKDNTWYMDATGTFHAASNIHVNPKLAENTHIRIPVPQPYISPATNPEYYGRKSEGNSW